MGLAEQVATGQTGLSGPYTPDRTYTPEPSGTPATPPPAPPGPEAIPPQPNLGNLGAGVYDPSTPLGQYLINNPTSRNAFDLLQTGLQQYGLTGSDIDQTLLNALQSGYTTQDEMMIALRQTPTYQRVFAPIIQRQKLGLPPISEADVVALRKGYADVNASMGMPQGFINNDEQDQLITNDVSVQEYNDRLTNGYQVALNDPAVSQNMDRLFQAGATPGLLAAYYLDPEKTDNLVKQQTTAAQIAAAGQRANYLNANNLSGQDLTNLAGQGITQSQAVSGFGTLAMEQGLFNPLPGENQGGAISQQEQMDSVFSNGANARRRIQSNLAQRQGAFQGGGQFETKQGATAAGSVL